MKLKKVASTFDTYQAELSFKELQALQAVAQGSGDPIVDELGKAIEWYFAHEVPPPGVEEHPDKAAKEAGATGEEVDAILPLPDGDEEAEDADGAPVPTEIPADGPPAGLGAEVPSAPGDEEIGVEAEEILPKG